MRVRMTAVLFGTIISGAVVSVTLPVYPLAQTAFQEQRRGEGLEVSPPPSWVVHHGAPMRLPSRKSI